MKHVMKIAAAVLLLSVTAAHAQHAGHGAHGKKGPSAPEWTQNPVLLSAGPRSRSAATYQAFYLHAMEGSAWASFDDNGGDAAKQALQSLAPDANGQTAVKAQATGGYYLVRVSGHGPNGEIATATTVKYFSNPGPAPRDMLKKARPGFEIAPAVLPREHGHYRENETWAFQVRNDGLPVSDKTVVLETSNGTKSEFTTDENGLVHVTFPQDTPDIPKDQWNHGRPPSSNFVVSVRDGGLLASYNDTYNRHGLAGKSVWAGIGFAVLGMAVAFPIVRRRNGK